MRIRGIAAGEREDGKLDVQISLAKVITPKQLDVVHAQGNFKYVKYIAGDLIVELIYDKSKYELISDAATAKRQLENDLLRVVALL